MADLLACRVYYANAGMNIATDLIIAALPVKAIWALQLPKRQRIALLIILSIGVMYVLLPPPLYSSLPNHTTSYSQPHSVCLSSALRLKSLIHFLNNIDDSTWSGVGAAYWSSIEVNLAIVCASTPALKPLVVRLIPAFSSYKKGTHISSKRAGTGSHNLSFSMKKSATFIELREKGSQVSAGDGDGDDVELGMVSPRALPQSDIRVATDIKQTFESVEELGERDVGDGGGVGRDSDSEKRLVSKPPASVWAGARRE